MDTFSKICLGLITAGLLVLAYSHLQARSSVDEQFTMQRATDENLHMAIERVSEQLEGTRSALSQIRATLGDLNLAVRREQTESQPVLDSQIESQPAPPRDFVADAAASPDASFYRSMATPAGTAALGAIAANRRFGQVLNELDLTPEERQATMEIIVDMLAQRTSEGMNLVIDGRNGDEYLASRATQEELDNMLRNSLSSVLNAGAIDAIIEQQESNRSSLASVDAMAVTALLAANGVDPEISGVVSSVLIEEFTRSYAIDAPSIGGGPPSNIAVAASGMAETQNAVYTVMRRVQEQLSSDDYTAVSEALQRLPGILETRVDAAWLNLERNAGGSR